MSHDSIISPAHYTVYPVEPIEITRYLGFCLGNATKYVLRAPYKGGVEDCLKALRYLEMLESYPQAPLLYWDYKGCLDACERLQEFLRTGQGDALWQDIATNQAEFLLNMQNYLCSRTLCLDGSNGANAGIRFMLHYAQELQRVLALRDTTGQIYEGMTGLPNQEPDHE